MRGRTWSACVALAWGILLIMTAVGPLGSLRAAQANIRIASTTGSTGSTGNTTNIIHAALTGDVTRPTAADDRPGAGTESHGYVVQPGDTLSGIAAAAGVRGGWPALYAANRVAVGPDPALIRPGTVLALPGRAAPARYTVGPGDTLSGIALALGSPGGWPALYAANRRAIGANPNAIRIGTVLTIPQPAPSASPAPSRGPVSAPGEAQSPARARASAPAPPASHRATPASGPPPAPAARPTHPASAHPASIAGLPRWLEIVLLAAGLLIGIAFLTEPTLTIARRLRAARSGAADRIVLADYDRLVVTHCGTDGKVYVLRPPDAEPEAILLAARLVLAQDRYEELAGHLGVPANWPRE